MKKSSRLHILKHILELNPDAYFITSAGYVSRELYNLHDSSRNFYMMGSLGCAVGFSIGIAMRQPEKEIVVITGDGEILYSLGTLVLTEYLKLHNLTIYILDDNKYKSTGGQQTCSEYIPKVGHNVFTSYIDDDSVPPRIDISPKEIMERFKNEINGM